MISLEPSGKCRHAQSCLIVAVTIQPPINSLGSESDVVEGVALGWVQGWVRHAQDLVQYISHSTELVELYRQAAL